MNTKLDFCMLLLTVESRQVSLQKNCGACSIIYIGLLSYCRVQTSLSSKELWCLFYHLHWIAILLQSLDKSLFRRTVVLVLSSTLDCYLTVESRQISLQKNCGACSIIYIGLLSYCRVQTSLSSEERWCLFYDLHWIAILLQSLDKSLFRRTVMFVLSSTLDC